MVDYASIRSVSTGVIEEFGGNISLDGRTVKAVRYDFTEQEYDGSNIVRGDVRFIISGTTATPTLATILIKDSTRWVVLSTEDISPADTSVVKILHCRLSR